MRLPPSLRSRRSSANELRRAFLSRSSILPQTPENERMELKRGEGTVLVH